MKSGKAEIYRPPGGRTERDVAAEVIARLLKGGVLSRSPSVIARASAAVGVPVALVREKWAVDGLAAVPFDGTLVSDDHESPGATVTPVATRPASPKPRYSPNYSASARAANEARRAKKEPVPGKRICSGKCGQLKNLDEFAIKNKRTQQRSAWCKECIRAYQQDRYLSSRKLDKLGPVLRFILEEGDEHAGVICPDCRQPCRIGDEVIASDAVLHHASHHEVGEP